MNDPERIETAENLVTSDGSARSRCNALGLSPRYKLAVLRQVQATRGLRMPGYKTARDSDKSQHLNADGPICTGAGAGLAPTEWDGWHCDHPKGLLVVLQCHSVAT